MTKKTRIIIFGIILALTLAFIWGNSMLSKEASGAISHLLADLLGGEQGSTDEGHYLLRKAGHFCEFAFLGVIFQLFVRELTGDSARRVLASALVGVSVPLIDETIQIFSNRGYALPDVWIDISGYALGTSLAILALWAVHLLRKKGKKE